MYALYVCVSVLIDTKLYALPAVWGCFAVYTLCLDKKNCNWYAKKNNEFIK